MLSVTGARRALDSHILFTDLALTVPSGCCAVIVGPNGSGKSTLLRCIIDDDHLDAGRIEIDGAEPDERSPRFRAAVAAETGDSPTFFDLTISEHFQLLAAAHRVSTAGIPTALDDAGLADLADRFPHALSTGQRQRFALAAVFFRPAQLLVLDEPERGLDAAGRDWLCTRVIDCLARGMAVVIATHSEQIRSLCAGVVVELGR